MTAPRWLRIAMLATAVMNAGAAVLFLPAASPLRELAGLPGEAPAVYLATVALFVLLFGAGYLSSASPAAPTRCSSASRRPASSPSCRCWWDSPPPARSRGARRPRPWATWVFGVLFLRWLCYGPRPS